MNLISIKTLIGVWFLVLGINLAWSAKGEAQSESINADTSFAQSNKTADTLASADSVQSDSVLVLTASDSLALAKIQRVSDINKKVSPSPVMAESKSFTAVLFQIVIGLVVVILMMVGTLYVLKRMQNGKFTQSVGGGVDFKLRGVHYVGPKQKVVVLSIDGHNYVLGITDQNVNLIAEHDVVYDDKDVIPPSQALMNSVDHLLARFKRPKNTEGKDV